MQKTALVVTLALAASLLFCAANSWPQSKTTRTAQTTRGKSNNSSKSAPAKEPKKVAAKAIDKSRRTRDESPASRREELRGIWITTDSPRDWDSLMKKLKDSGLNAAFVRVAQGGRAIFPSQILPQDQWSADTGEDELAKAVEAAHRHGIQIHAWKVCFPMGAARLRPTGSPALAYFERMAREDRLVRDTKGNQTSWLNPSDSRNHDLEVRVAGEVVQNYAVDGYHLDYIRYPASEAGGEPGFDAHYDEVSRREFEKSIGKTVRNWPNDVAAGSLKMQYEDWERDNLTRLVSRIRAEVKSKRPGTLLSAAVWRKVHLYRSWIKQDWPRWCRDGLLDFVVPMCYEKDPQEFRTVLARDFSQVCGQVPFVAGIGNYRIYTPEGLVEQVQVARDLGTDGFVLFSINDPTDETNPKVYYKGLVDRQLAALGAGLTRSTVPTGLGAPRLRFVPSAGIVPRRYQNLAAEAGAINQTTIQLPKLPGASGELRVTVCVEDPGGQRIGDVQNLTFKPGSEQVIPLVAAVTAVRPVVRGSVGHGAGARHFVLRGPIVEPISHSEVDKLRASQEPPRVSGSGTKVGVYFNTFGADAILEAMAQVKGIVPVTIHHLEPSHLAQVEVLVLPHFFELGDLTPKAIQAVRNWVEAGGKLILTRDAVGLRWHPRLFPEIGVGTALVRSRAVLVASALRSFSKGTRFDHEYQDHVQLEVKPAAKILLTEAKSGKPVAAFGKVGRGTVILNGLRPGSEDEADPDTNSMRFLVALLQLR